MGQRIQLKTADGATIGAYQADPAIASLGGIVVVHEIFGVNGHIRSVADRFAAEGYTALAPAIFDRAEKDVELAYDEAGVARGMELARAISQEQHLASIEAAVDTLAERGPVAVVGFCLGGSLAYAMAARDHRLAAAVAYYGGNIAKMADARPNCPIILHFGEADQSIPPADVETIRKAHPDVPIFTYPGAEHGFNCDARASFDKSSADLAWSRTLAFLAQNVGAAKA